MSGPKSEPPAESLSLYERYKDALRRGHVAALRGRNDAAIDAYGEAASIAPDRALPHASIGGVLARMGRPTDAIAAYERALKLAPRDETALRGIADALAAERRRSEAAAALDRLADVLEVASRIADATDAARRALELAESRARRRHLEALVARLRAAPASGDASDSAGTEGSGETAADMAAPTGDANRRALGLAIAVLERASTRSATTDREESGRRGPADDDSDEAATSGGPTAPTSGTEAASADGPANDARADEPVGEPAGLGIALGAAAEAHLNAGELEEAHAGLLAAARAHRRAGRLVAALDACDLAVGVAPADPDLHLLLAELYLDRGWRQLATDKLVLLARIADLDADAATRERLRELVAERLSDEPRLADLVA